MNTTLLIAIYAAFILAVLFTARNQRILDAAVKQCRVVVSVSWKFPMYETTCRKWHRCPSHAKIQKRIELLDRVVMGTSVPLALLTLRSVHPDFGPTGQRTTAIAAVLLAVLVSFLLADRIQAARGIEAVEA